MQIRKVSARGDDLLLKKKREEKWLINRIGSIDRNVWKPFERGARFI